MTAGTYGGGTFGFPFGLGGGLYVDNQGRIYPQLYGGTPTLSFSGGYTPNLEGLLTGPSISVSPGAGSIRLNVAGNPDTMGVGIGMPGVGVTHGFGPLEMSNDYSRPWTTPEIRDSAARAGTSSRYNVWEYDYPDSNKRSPPPDAPATAPRGAQQVEPGTPAFEPDAINFPRAENPEQAPVRYLGRRTLGQTPRSAFDIGAQAVDSPTQFAANQSQPSPIEAGPSASPRIPSDDSNFSGGLPGRIAALMGIDLQNPNQFVPPPRDEDLRAFYRDDPMQPWLVQR